MRTLGEDANERDGGFVGERDKWKGSARLFAEITKRAGLLVEVGCQVSALVLQMRERDFRSYVFLEETEVKEQGRIESRRCHWDRVGRRYSYGTWDRELDSRDGIVGKIVILLS